MFFSTSQPGSSMINQNPWMWHFDPNDMLWKEPDVEWRTRASSRCGGVWLEGGKGGSEKLSWVSL